jgi:hypothetical protein
VKFFLLDEKELRLVAKEKRAAARKNMMGLKKAAATAEMGYWKTMYGVEDVCVIELNKTWCLAMPYFDPVTTDEREGQLPEVVKLLAHFKDKGFRYEDGDLRCRHVCQRGGFVKLIDLGSLEPCDEKGIDPKSQDFFARDDAVT